MTKAELYKVQARLDMAGELLKKAEIEQQFNNDTSEMLSAAHVSLKKAVAELISTEGRDV